MSLLMDSASVTSAAGTQRLEEVLLGCPQLLPTMLEGSLLRAPLSPPLLGRSDSIKKQQRASLVAQWLRI